MAKNNNAIEEIKELIKQISEYQEGVDYEFVTEKEGVKREEAA
ncbi:MAG: hypothetical protein NY202_01735 [Mollicutes bacterium UO1]